MKVVVIGGGLLGLTSAYFLSKQGCAVTVVEREAGPGLQTSFANGALLTPSMPEPWNSPGSWRLLLASLFRSDLPLKLHASALPHLLGWGLRFLHNSSPARFADNTARNLRLALYSASVLADLRQATGIDYAASAAGTLKIFRAEQSLETAARAAAALAAQGLRLNVLTREQVIELEPALAPITGELAGGIYYPDDATGDAYQFCVGLAGWLRDRGVGFCFGEEVRSLEMRDDQVIAVRGVSNPIDADACVVAAGSYSPLLMRRLGINLPVRPVKGYSVTFEAPLPLSPLRIPVVDDQLHAAVVPLGRSIRVAGTAEFAGYDRSLSPARVQNLIGLMKRVLPEAPIETAIAKPWCGLRPMSTDGVPIIGRTAIANLFVNAGHGHLGWTLAAGSGCLLADVVCGRTPALDGVSYSPGRFR
jgi:D-amino-acid dehydrogenase